MSLAPRCVTVIPTVKAGPLLAAALEAIEAAWRASCVVVANAAPEAELAALGRRFPELTIVRLGANQGFARAVNLGISRGATADTEVALVLNDDVIATPEALDALVQALLADPGAGSAAGVLLDPSGRIDTAGIRCDPALASMDVGRGRALEQLGGSADPLGPSGGFAAYRLPALAAAGGFDERFFAYYEDVDLALRLRLSGWGCALARDAVARHVGSATLGWRSVHKAAIVGRSRGQIARKYGTHRQPRAWPALLLELAAGTGLSLELRSTAPLRARVAGFFSESTERPYPAELVEPGGFRRTIVERLSRRYRRTPALQFRRGNSGRTLRGEQRLRGEQATTTEQR